MSTGFFSDYKLQFLRKLSVIDFFFVLPVCNIRLLYTSLSLMPCDKKQTKELRIPDIPGGKKGVEEVEEGGENGERVAKRAVVERRDGVMRGWRRGGMV